MPGLLRAELAQLTSMKKVDSKPVNNEEVAAFLKEPKRLRDLTVCSIAKLEKWQVKWVDLVDLLFPLVLQSEWRRNKFFSFIEGHSTAKIKLIFEMQVVVDDLD
uniref:DHC_N2 domain-containing protein n=1 Tax=Syphacia muris TaxID=451379 RepID=A0A0N5B1A4_9BILA